MAARHPRLETLMKVDPVRARKIIDSMDSYIEDQGSRLGIDSKKVRETVKAIGTVGDYVAYAQGLQQDKQTESVGKILLYPLPFLMNPKLLQENGRPNWPLMNTLYKDVRYSLRLPLHDDTEMTFEVAQAFLSIALSPMYGRGADLEAGAVMADSMRLRRNPNSFGQALLFLQSLSYVKAIEKHPA